MMTDFVRGYSSTTIKMHAPAEIIRAEVLLNKLNQCMSNTRGLECHTLMHMHEM